uniref:Uncharacterized protein n=1 Tax=Ananas comosus var. bracteatus TaxID=296719 RepID=A0A6V7NPV7_ANACO|nr:unnamed protein product [Ananas comosus var. bracteatus]
METQTLPSTSFTNCSTSTSTLPSTSFTNCLTSTPTLREYQLHQRLDLNADAVEYQLHQLLDLNSDAAEYQLHQLLNLNSDAAEYQLYQLLDLYPKLPSTSFTNHSTSVLLSPAITWHFINRAFYAHRATHAVINLYYAGSPSANKIRPLIGILTPLLTAIAPSSLIPEWCTFPFAVVASSSTKEMAILLLLLR